MTDTGRRRGLWLVVVVLVVAALALLPFACEEEEAAPPATPKPVAEAPKPPAVRARGDAPPPRVAAGAQAHDGSHVFRVVSDTGNPIQGARVWVRRPPGGVLRLPTTPPTLTTGEDGLVRLAPDSGVRVVDVAAKGRLSRRLRVPAGRCEDARAEDVALDRGWTPIRWVIDDVTRAVALAARPRGALWPRGTRPAGGPPPGATDEELTALGAIIVPSDARDLIAFEGAYRDEHCVDLIAAGRVAVPFGQRGGAPRGDLEKGGAWAEWPGGRLVPAVVARISVVDEVTGRPVDGVVFDEAANRRTAGELRTLRFGAREPELWDRLSGLRDVTDQWSLREPTRPLRQSAEALPPAPVRTVAWFSPPKEPANAQTIGLRIAAPGYDPVAQKIEFAPPWSGTPIPVIEVKLKPSASREIVPFTFVDGTGAPLGGVFVDAPFAPTGQSVEGPSRDGAPVRVRGFTDARGGLSAAVAVGTWTPWRGSDHLPTWEVSDFGVRPGQAESARAMLAEALARIVIVDPDGEPVRYSLPLLVSHEPVEHALRRPGQDGRADGQTEAFVASPHVAGTYLPLRAFHYGRRRFRAEGAFVEGASGVTVDVPFQGSAEVRLTTRE